MIDETLSPAARELLRGRDSLCAYFAAQRPTYELYRHQKIILEHCEAMERGEIENLMVFMPPQNGKSSSITTVFPAWFFGRHPDRLIFLSAYSQELTNDFAGEIRDFVQTDYHRAIFPECELDKTANALHDFRTTAGGACRSAGRGGSITGRGAHLYVIDDPEKDKREAQSDTVQRELRQWFNTVVMTRRAPGAHVCMVKTRWDTLDLAGWELAQHAGEWTVVELPALGKWQPGGTRIADENGGALWPERYSKQWLENMRSRLARDEWLALYQQKPAREGDDRIFSEEWFQTFHPKPNYEDIRQMFIEIIVDPAKGKKKKHDYTVMWVIGLAPDRNFYFVDGLRARLGLRERWEGLRDLHKKWSPNGRRLRVWYEEISGMQSDLEYFDERMKEEGYRFAINRIGTTQVSKEDWIKDFGTGICKDRRVFFNSHIWCTTDGRKTNLTADLLDQEWNRYPAVAHDDMLNTAAYVTDARIAKAFPNPTQNASTAEFYKRWRERRAGSSPYGA